MRMGTFLTAGFCRKWISPAAPSPFDAGRVVTVAVTVMSFQRPVFVGDEVTCAAHAAEPSAERGSWVVSDLAVFDAHDVPRPPGHSRAFCTRHTMLRR